MRVCVCVCEPVRGQMTLLALAFCLRNIYHCLSGLVLLLPRRHGDQGDIPERSFLPAHLLWQEDRGDRGAAL